jgi:hypothetical protein
VQFPSPSRPFNTHNSAKGLEYVIESTDAGARNCGNAAKLCAHREFTNRETRTHARLVQTLIRRAALLAQELLLAAHIQLAADKQAAH